MIKNLVFLQNVLQQTLDLIIPIEQWNVYLKVVNDKTFLEINNHLIDVSGFNELGIYKTFNIYLKQKGIL